MTVVVITSIPSPYQVELFDALAADEPGFRAVYVSRRDRSRSWADPKLQHRAMVLDEVGTANSELNRWVDEAGLVVFSDYSSRGVRDAMRRRAAAGKPWCFWGERPGFHGLGRLGQMRRRIGLAPLHRNRRVPIWGIGQWAVDEYRKEFGGGRLYCNVPYFSNLERFRAAGAGRTRASETIRFLYSGSLIKRKGVDILAKAFARLAEVRQNITLSVIGTGPLRPLMERILGTAAPRVRFHGFVTWPDLPKHYAQADVLCAPSRYDGWGLIVPEAMAAAMPVIATDRMGAALELIDHRGNGWLIGAGDEHRLFEALREAADMPPSRLRVMALAAQSRSGAQGIAAGMVRFRKAVEATSAVWHQGAPRSSVRAKLPA